MIRKLNRIGLNFLTWNYLPCIVSLVISVSTSIHTWKVETIMARTATNTRRLWTHSTPGSSNHPSSNSPWTRARSGEQNSMRLRVSWSITIHTIDQIWRTIVSFLMRHSSGWPMSRQLNTAVRSVLKSSHHRILHWTANSLRGLSFGTTSKKQWKNWARNLSRSKHRKEILLSIARMRRINFDGTQRKEIALPMLRNSGTAPGQEQTEHLKAKIPFRLWNGRKNCRKMRSCNMLLSASVVEQVERSRVKSFKRTKNRKRKIMDRNHQLLIESWPAT
jgi:hypothetical protein